MKTRDFAMIAGVVFIVVGVLGFVPPLLTRPAGAPPLVVDEAYGYLFGLFPVNVLHSLVHLAIGVWGVIAARAWSTSRIFAISLAVIYGVLTILGLIPRLDTLFGYVPLFGHDVWLHALTAIVAAYFGFRETEEAAELRERTRRAA